MLRHIARFSASHLLRISLIAAALAGAATLPAPAAEDAVDRAPVAALAQIGSSASFGQSSRNNEPGRFEFYLLALSWSPSFCEVSRERYADRRPDPQCGARPYSFVVHGLWPQHERGFPANCQVPAPRINRGLVDSMLDLMPSPRLVFHEWDSHGTCTGLSAVDYFATVRKARAAVTVPAEYQAISEPLTVAPAQVAEAFVKANPGLRRDALAVICDGKRLTGVRVCLSKDLGFRDCAEVARNSCRSDSVVMPPVRGSRAALR